jgi:hypothetical protein
MRHEQDWDIDKVFWRSHESGESGTISNVARMLLNARFALRCVLRPTRESSLALIKVEEALMWLEEIL